MVRNVPIGHWFKMYEDRQEPNRVSLGWSKMPRYFFHVRQGDELFEDLDGSVMANLPAAITEANLSAIDLVCDSLRSGTGLQLDRSVIIADEKGQTLEEVLFTGAVLPAGR